MFAFPMSASLICCILFSDKWTGRDVLHPRPIGAASKQASKLNEQL